MSLTGDYLNRTYAGAAGPWGFDSRWYEQRKYALTLAALPTASYDSGLEIDCSIGILTTQLAQRCHELAAVDLSPAALAAARARVPAKVRLLQGGVPEGWPAGSYDLVVLSLAPCRPGLIAQRRPGAHRAGPLAAAVQGGGGLPAGHPGAAAPTAWRDARAGQVSRATSGSPGPWGSRRSSRGSRDAQRSSSGSPRRTPTRPCPPTGSPSSCASRAERGVSRT